MSVKMNLDDTFLALVDSVSNLEVVSLAYRGVAGIWVQASDGNRAAGLVFQPGTPSYLAVWDGADTTPLAITHDGIQLPQKLPTDPRMFIAWADLLKLVPVKHY